MLLSGGRDSVCLLDLSRRICGPAAVRALHVNYGLRPGAVLDERHCSALCERLEVPLAVERPAGPQGPGNLQAWARELRYRLARSRAGTAAVAVGHTADDQVETILLRLISAPSRRAVLGMGAQGDGLLRPLLGLTRAETTAYCDARELPFRDDPTNAEPTFVRNRIRHELIPLLRELHPGATENLLSLAGILREEAEVLAAEAQRARAGRGEIPLAELRGWSVGLARLVLQGLADEARGGPAAGVGARCGDILAMGEEAILDLPGGVRAITRGGAVGFERTPPLSR